VTASVPASGSTGVASASASQGSSAGSSASVSASVGTTASAIVSSSVVSAGGHTYTTYQTTMITITSCPGDCTSTASQAASNSNSATVNTNSAANSAYSSGVSALSSAKQSASSSSFVASQSGASVGTASPSPASSSAVTAAAPSGTACPASLNGEYQYPHLIVPVDSQQPNKAYGTQYNGTITPTVSTIFNFDLPTSYSGKTCSLVFLLPEQAALETSAYTFNGQGGITVNELSSPATQQTTYDSVPKAAVEGLGSVASVQAGQSYVIRSHQCNAGATQSFEFVSTGGLSLEWFEDWYVIPSSNSDVDAVANRRHRNPSPIGAFITVC